MASLSVHPLTFADVEACAQLVGACAFFASWGLDASQVRAQLLDALAADGVILGLKDAAHLLGFVWLMPRGAFGRSAYVRLLAVGEPHRRREVSQEEAQRIALMKERGYSVKQEKSDYERRFGSDTEKGPRHVDATKTYYLPGEKPDMEAGINPFILFLIGLIVAGLIFFIFKNQSAGGGD